MPTTYFNLLLLIELKSICAQYCLLEKIFFSFINNFQNVEDNMQTILSSYQNIQKVVKIGFTWTVSVLEFHVEVYEDCNRIVFKKSVVVQSLNCWASILNRFRANVISKV